jgi:hypothetical protein
VQLFGPISIGTPLDWRKIKWARYLPSSTQYWKGGTLTNYSTWTSGAAKLDVIYKSGNSLYMAMTTDTPTSATDENVFVIIYPDITIGMLLGDTPVASIKT